MIYMESSVSYSFVCAVDKPTVAGSCANVLLEARVMGHIDVSVVYKHGSILLRTSVTVAAYRPLRVRYSS
jgi:hypothetical protein